MYKNINKGKKTLGNSSPPYQTYTTNVKLKADRHTGGDWIIHGPKHHKEKQLLSLKTLLLIILNLPWLLSNPLFEKKVRG